METVKLKVVEQSKEYQIDFNKVKTVEDCINILNALKVSFYMPISEIEHSPVKDMLMEVRINGQVLGYGNKPD